MMKEMRRQSLPQLRRGAKSHSEMSNDGRRSTSVGVTMAGSVYDGVSQHRRAEQSHGSFRKIKKPLCHRCDTSTVGTRSQEFTESLADKTGVHRPNHNR